MNLLSMRRRLMGQHFAASATVEMFTKEGPIGKSITFSGLKENPSFMFLAVTSQTSFKASSSVQYLLSAQRSLSNNALRKIVYSSDEYKTGITSEGLELSYSNGRLTLETPYQLFVNTSSTPFEYNCIVIYGEPRIEVCDLFTSGSDKYFTPTAQPQIAIYQGQALNNAAVGTCSYYVYSSIANTGHGLACAQASSNTLTTSYPVSISWNASTNRATITRTGGTGSNNLQIISISGIKT